MALVGWQASQQVFVPRVDIFQRLFRVSARVDGVLDPMGDTGSGAVRAQALVKDHPSDDKLELGTQSRVSINGAHNV